MLQLSEVGLRRVRISRRGIVERILEAALGAGAAVRLPFGLALGLARCLPGGLSLLTGLFVLADRHRQGNGSDTGNNKALLDHLLEAR